MNEIWLVVYAGPEWTTPVKAFKNQKDAREYKAEQNAELRSKKNPDVYETLSSYECRLVPFEDGTGIQ